MFFNNLKGEKIRNYSSVQASASHLFIDKRSFFFFVFNAQEIILWGKKSNSV